MQLVDVPVCLGRLVVIEYFSLRVKIANSLIKRVEHKIEVGCLKLYQPSLLVQNV